MTWVQREMHRLILDIPEVLEGFTLSVKYVFNAGFSGDSGTRIFWERSDSQAAVRRKIQEKSSETIVMDVVAQELSRVDNFCTKLGFKTTVVTL